MENMVGEHQKMVSELQVIDITKNFVNKQRKLFKAIAAERLAIIDLDDSIRNDADSLCGQ